MSDKNLFLHYTLIGKDKDRNPIIRPVVGVELSYFKVGQIDGESRKMALIDSGADRCIFRSEIADELGITDLEKGIRYDFGGVADGAQLVGYIHKIGISVGSFPMYTLSAVFTRQMSGIADCLLGQNGFFDHFAVKLDLRRNEITIKSK